MTSALKSGMVSPRISSRRSTVSSNQVSSISPNISSRSISSNRLEVVPSLRSRRRSSRFQTGVTLPVPTSPTAVNQHVVTSLPQTQAPPAWLKLLIRAQHASSVAVLGLVVATLAVYGWTVYVQQRWGQEYQRFETLKKQERQLISGNEALKNDIARQAESPTSGLIVPDPTNAVFLTPAAPRAPEAPDRPFSSQSIPAKPLGY